MSEPKICPKHNEPLVKVGKDWFCKSCLHAAHLTHEAQKAAQKRWRQSERGKQKIREHEQGAGKAARQRYLKGAKYKQKRKEYNERLKESLEIARTIRKNIVTVGPEVIQQKMAALSRDIRDYSSWGKKPPVEEVIAWAKGYNLDLTPEQARELISKS